MAGYYFCIHVYKHICIERNLYTHFLYICMYVNMPPDKAGQSILQGSVDRPAGLRADVDRKSGGTCKRLEYRFVYVHVGIHIRRHTHAHPRYLVYMYVLYIYNQCMHIECHQSEYRFSLSLSLFLCVSLASFFSFLFFFLLFVGVGTCSVPGHL